MLRMDRKTCHDILKVTNSYDTSIFFHPNIGGFCIWTGLVPDQGSVKPSIPISEVPGSLNRLCEQKLIEKMIGTMDNGMIFRIAPELLHYKAFWWERFTKTYVAGFFSGIAATVIAGLILHFFTGLF